MAGQPLSARRRVVTLVAMCVAQGMILLDNTIVNVALPSIQRELDVDPGNLIWVVNAYVLALLAHHGRRDIGDRYGGKRMFLIGLAIFTAMSAACALSPNESVLIAARAAQGVGAALVAPLSLSILADAYPPERRTAAIGIWAAAAGLGFGAGPVVGGILVETVLLVGGVLGERTHRDHRAGAGDHRCPRVAQPTCPQAGSRWCRARRAGVVRADFRDRRSEHFGWTPRP